MTNEINKISKQLAGKVLQADLSQAQTKAVVEGVRQVKVFVAVDGPAIDPWARFPWGTRWDTKAAIAEKLGPEVLRWVPGTGRGLGQYEWGTMVLGLAWAKHDIA